MIFFLAKYLQVEMPPLHTMKATNWRIAASRFRFTVLMPIDWC